MCKWFYIFGYFLIYAYGHEGFCSEGAQGLKTRIGEISGILKRKIPKLLKRERVIESWID